MERLSLLQPREPPPESLPPHSNLYLSGGINSLDEHALHALFAPFGMVVSIRLVRNKRLPRKAFGFVKYSAVESAAAAIRALDGTVLGPDSVLEVRSADADAGDRKPATVPTASESL